MALPLLRMEIRQENDVVLVRQRARQIAAALKFDSQDKRAWRQPYRKQRGMPSSTLSQAFLRHFPQGGTDADPTHDQMVAAE